MSTSRSWRRRTPSLCSSCWWICKNALHARGMRLTVDVAFYDPAYDLEFIGQVADAVFVMGYDQHYPASKPGPVSGRKWFSESVQAALTRVKADRLVVAIGAYCYDWIVGRKRSARRELSPSVKPWIVRALPAPCPSSSATPKMPASATATRSSECTRSGVRMRSAPGTRRPTLREHGVSRVALWRLGTEDETLWTFLGERQAPRQRVALATIQHSRSVDLFGEGEVLTHPRASPRRASARWRSTPQPRHLRALRRRRPPASWSSVAARRARTSCSRSTTGPIPSGRRSCCACSTSSRFRATFFVVGDQAMQYPDLVADIDRAGHLIGNHTFSHPHLDKLTPAETVVELNATARLLEGLTGTRSPLFRAPYTANVDPSRPEDLGPLRVALQNGYVFVGANIDPLDWELAERQADRAPHGGAGRAGRSHRAACTTAAAIAAQTIEALHIAVPELRKTRLSLRLGGPVHGRVARRAGRAARVTRRPRWRGAISSVARARSWGWIAARGAVLRLHRAGDRARGRCSVRSRWCRRASATPRKVDGLRARW